MNGLSPQKENGYTDIANELMEAFGKFRIPGEVRQVLDIIMRQTYGYHKKADWISNSQFIEKTNLNKGNVSRSLSKLITHKLVIKTDNKLSLNKNYREWIPFTRVVIKTDNSVIKSETKVIQLDNKKLSKVRDTKPMKPNIQNQIYKTNTNVAEILPINRLISLFAPINPSYKQLYPKKGQRDALTRMINEHGLERIERVIRSLPVVVGKPFAPTITTPFELEKKLGSLIAYMKREHIGSEKFSVTKV